MNESNISVLSELPVHVSGEIRELRDGGRNITSRLSTLGFKKGAVVECIGKSPLGGMRAYKITGAVIALRDEDARCVITSYGSPS